MTRSQFLTNLQFEADGVRSWRAYGIGKGKLEKSSHLEPVKQKESNLNILQLFSLPSKVGHPATYKNYDICSLHQLIKL